MINATSSVKDFDPVPAGTHIARCYQMIQIGTVPETFEGNTKDTPKVRIGFELPNEKKVFHEGEEARPFAISKEYTLSMNEKANLRKMLESWRGKQFSDEEAVSFDITKLLGKECMISVIHKTSKQGRTYADIATVSPVPKGMEAPAQINASVILSFDNFDKEVFEKLPNFIKDKIKTSKEYKAMGSEVGTEYPTDDITPESIPF